jgi:acyl-coenzyme A thioesterase PaaI-like protein
MEDMLTLGKQILAAQPFSGLLGSELISWSDAGAELKIPVKAELNQQNRFVHGASSAMRPTTRSFTRAEVLRARA